MKSFFENYNPELPDTADFMSELLKNMDSVEFIKRRTAAMAKRNRFAAAIAVLVGFLAGITLTLAFPQIVKLLNDINFTVRGFTVSFDGDYLAWIIVASASVFAALGTYYVARNSVVPVTQKL